MEVSWIKDEKVRSKAKKLLKMSHLTVAYGAQPRLLVNNLNLNSFAEEERKKVADVKFKIITFDAEAESMSAVVGKHVDAFCFNVVDTTAPLLF